ncbi:MULTISPECIES: carbonic anhydrase [unclassified Sphingomonas]|jgi:carbonic anhydrase|nr:carbonic anhydrase [Sphingomonas sp. FARSPH]AXJ97385.1 carbonic anhydrase [Sphingomonas sp. FARSPH]
MTPTEALARLRDGNRAFLNDEPLQPSLDRESRLALAGGQKPFAAYVSCSDSRVPPELLFGRGLGELFIVRNAGNTLDVAAMGSLEFAVSVLGVPLIVVMGHEGCGAVNAAMSVVNKGARFPGNIGKMVEPIIPAVLEAARLDDATLEGAVRQNVAHAVRELREDSAPTLIEAQASGRLLVVGAYYALGTGEVDFFDTGAGSSAFKTS